MNFETLTQERHDILVGILMLFVGLVFLVYIEVTLYYTGKRMRERNALIESVE